MKKCSMIKAACLFYQHNLSDFCSDLLLVGHVAFSCCSFSQDWGQALCIPLAVRICHYTWAYLSVSICVHRARGQLFMTPQLGVRLDSFSFGVAGQNEWARCCAVLPCHTLHMFGISPAWPEQQGPGMGTMCDHMPACMYGTCLHIH